MILAIMFLSIAVIFLGLWIRSVRRELHKTEQRLLACTPARGEIEKRFYEYKQQILGSFDNVAMKFPSREYVDTKTEDAIFDLAWELGYTREGSKLIPAKWVKRKEKKR